MPRFDALSVTLFFHLCAKFIVRVEPTDMRSPWEKY